MITEKILQKISKGGDNILPEYLFANSSSIFLFSLLHVSISIQAFSQVYFSIMSLNLAGS